MLLKKLIKLINSILIKLMFYYSDDNDYSDEDDYYIELPNDIKEEIEYDLKMNIINRFKSYIKDEPQFIGINNICSAKILNIIENNNTYTYYYYNDFLNKHEINLLDNLCKELFNETYSIDIYNNIASKIFEVIYI